MTVKYFLTFFLHEWLFFLPLTGSCGSYRKVCMQCTVSLHSLLHLPIISTVSQSRPHFATPAPTTHTTVCQTPDQSVGGFLTAFGLCLVYDGPLVKYWHSSQSRNPDSQVCLPVTFVVKWPEAADSEDDLVWRIKEVWGVSALSGMKIYPAVIRDARYWASYVSAFHQDGPDIR